MNYHEKRLEICKGCEFYMRATGQCKKCWCFMKVKTRIKSLACPIGKYPKIKSPKEEKVLVEFVQSLSGRVKPQDQKRFWDIYQEYIDPKKRPTRCSSYFFAAVRELQKHFK